MGLGRAIEGAKWLLKLNRAAIAIESEGRMYDVKVTLIKGLKALAITTGAVAGAAALGYLADPIHVSAALAGSLSPVIVAALVPIITSAAHMGLNWLKNR